MSGYADLSPEAYERSLARNRRVEPLFHSDPVVMRKCLKCKVEFQSRGDHICPTCNEVNRRGGRRVDKSVGRSRSGQGQSDN